MVIVRPVDLMADTDRRSFPNDRPYFPREAAIGILSRLVIDVEIATA